MDSTWRGGRQGSRMRAGAVVPSGGSACGGRGASRRWRIDVSGWTMIIFCPRCLAFLAAVNCSVVSRQFCAPEFSGSLRLQLLAGAAGWCGVKSHVRNPTSEIPRPKSHVRNPTSEIPRPKSHVRNRRVRNRRALPRSRFGLEWTGISARRGGRTGGRRGGPIFRPVPVRPGPDAARPVGGTVRRCLAPAEAVAAAC